MPELRTENGSLMKQLSTEALGFVNIAPRAYVMLYSLVEVADTFDESSR